MTKQQIDNWLTQMGTNKARNLVIIDFANVAKWEDSLGWKIGIKRLGQLISHIAAGKKPLRRFYYGQDFGPRISSTDVSPWSKTVTTQAQYSSFTLVTKRVKYIVQPGGSTTKKCDLDVDMTIDLIRKKDDYDTAIIFSGDGDLASAYTYIHEELGKKVFVFCVRDFLGAEIIDAKSAGTVSDIFFAEDFEYRLNLDR